MSSVTGNLLMSAVLCLVLPSTALAQYRPSPVVGEAPPTALPDAIFLAVRDRPVVLQLTDGREVAAHILAVETSLLVISVNASGQVRTLPRARVTTVRLLPAAPPTFLALDGAEPSGPPPRPRHVAVNLSLSPGIDLDVDAGLFHGFANFGIVLTMGTSGRIIPASFGLGVGIPVSRNRALKLDLFAHLNVVQDAFGNLSDYGVGRGNGVSFGAGLGLHYTWNNGLTLGFTVPIVGYGVQFGQTSSSGRPGPEEGVVNYLLTSFTALPLAYMGYRI